MHQTQFIKVLKNVVIIVGNHFRRYSCSLRQGVYKRRENELHIRH